MPCPDIIVISTKLLSRKVCSFLFSSVLLLKLPIQTPYYQCDDACQSPLTGLSWLPPVLPCRSLLLTRHLPQTHLLARGLIKDQLHHVFFLLNSFAKIFKFVFPVPTYILNHPFFIIMTNNSVDEFFVFLASPLARNKFIYI